LIPSNFILVREIVGVRHHDENALTPQECTLKPFHTWRSSQKSDIEPEALDGRDVIGSSALDDLSADTGVALRISA
jgi:hypothetical protein